MRKEVVIELKNSTTREAVNIFLAGLLDENLVSALLVACEVPSRDMVVQSLVSKADQVKTAHVFAPVLAVNGARIVSSMTRVSPCRKPVGIVLRSCEIRALVELVKLKQASLDNLLLIGVDCLGTYAVKDYQDLCRQDISPEGERVKSLATGKEDARLRQACRVCEYPVPGNVDITVGLLGVDMTKNIFLQAHTSAGEEILGRFSYPECDAYKQREKRVAAYSNEKVKKRDELFARTQKEVEGWENLISFFSTCINCHNCMRVCPLCYCRECFFESSCFEFDSDNYLTWAEKKGAIKMPRDTALFHLGRMSHMATSCVGCGACEEACPGNIPLLKLFKMVGHSVQEVFQYIPGRELEEPLPLATFKEDELQRIGEDE